MTLNGVMALFWVISANSGSFRAYCVKVHVRYLISWWVLVIWTLPFIVWHNAEGWRSRKTSRSRPCKVSVSSRGKNQTSRSRLGLVELQEGLGLGLVSDQKPNVSISSRSRKLRSRLHPWQIETLNKVVFSLIWFLSPSIFTLYLILL